MGSAASTAAAGNSSSASKSNAAARRALDVPDGSVLLHAPSGTRIILLPGAPPAPGAASSFLRKTVQSLKPSAVFAYHPNPALLLHSGAAPALPTRAQLLDITSDLVHIQDAQSQPSRSFDDLMQGWQLPPSAASLLSSSIPDDAGSATLTLRGMGPSLWYGRVMKTPLHFATRFALTAALQQGLPVALLDAEWCAAGEAKAILNDKVAPLPVSPRTWATWLGSVLPSLWPAADWPFLLGSAAAVASPPLPTAFAQQLREEQAMAPTSARLTTQSPASCVDLRHASLHWHPPEQLFQGIPVGWAAESLLPSAIRAIHRATQLTSVATDTAGSSVLVTALRRGSLLISTRADGEQVEAADRLVGRLQHNATWNLAHNPNTAWAADIAGHAVNVARRALHACHALSLGSDDVVLMVLPPVLAEAVQGCWDAQCSKWTAVATNGFGSEDAGRMLQAGFAGGARRWADVQVGGNGTGGGLSRIGGGAPMASLVPSAMGMSAEDMQVVLDAAVGMPEWWSSCGLPLQLQAQAAAIEMGGAAPAAATVQQQGYSLRERFDESRQAHVAAAAAGAVGVLAVLQAAKRIHRNVGLLVGAVAGWQAGSFLNQQDARALSAARRVVQEETLKFSESSTLASAAIRQAAAPTGGRKG